LSIFNDHKVELHRHLDGSLRPSTLFELNQLKNEPIFKNVDNYDDFEDLATCKNGSKDLMDFLTKMNKSVELVVSDFDAIERMAREAVEDLKTEGIM